MFFDVTIQPRQHSLLKAHGTGRRHDYTVVAGSDAANNSGGARIPQVFSEDSS